MRKTDPQQGHREGNVTARRITGGKRTDLRDKYKHVGNGKGTSWIFLPVFADFSDIRGGGLGRDSGLGQC